MRKPLVLLHDEIKSPPFSAAARIEAGTLLRFLQEGESLGMPKSRPMPSIGRRCHELRTRDEDGTRRIFSRIDPDAVLVAGVLISKTTRATPRHVIDLCKGRLKRYDDEAKQAEEGG